VLVVEDEAGLRRLVVRTLSRHGYKVLEASSGLEGLDVAQQAGDELRLVISDVVMPKMSGPEMVRKLREIRPDLKVMYTSGYAGDAMARKGLIEANAPVLDKPFTAFDLLDKVRELLSVQ
jgi:CheY-like chemotaxis protein